MSGRQYKQVAYGLSQPLIPENPTPIYARRDPTVRDFAIPSTIWINSLTNTIWILATVANNAANWVQVQAGGGGGAGIFTSLTVTPGPTAITGVTGIQGNTSINTVGAGTTAIGTGGTGAVTIGNTTGNTAVTGSLGATTTITAGTGLIATTGGVTASAGNIVATLGDITSSAGNLNAPAGNVNVGIGVTAGTGNITATLGNVTVGANAAAFVLGVGTQILSGATNPPTVVAPLGSLWLSTTGSGVGDRAYISLGAGNWTAITTAA